jgi:hypothetical protein
MAVIFFQILIAIFFLFATFARPQMESQPDEETKIEAGKYSAVKL